MYEDHHRGNDDVIFLDESAQETLLLFLGMAEQIEDKQVIKSLQQRVSNVNEH